MKLESFLIREAFDADDFGAVIRVIERHFGASFPDSAFNEEHHTISRHRSNEYAIDITCMNQRYSWSSFHGFTLHYVSRVGVDYVHARIFTNRMK